MKTKQIVEIWARGYATEEGLTRFGVDATPEEIPGIVRELFGSFAEIVYVRPAFPPANPNPPVSEAYARAMSRNDNT